jgi:DNA-binding CsgD family transcriptional regulator
MISYIVYTNGGARPVEELGFEAYGGLMGVTQVGICGLTDRERSAFDLLLIGKCNKEIASALGITVRTVRFHVSNILGKCGVENRVALLVSYGPWSQETIRATKPDGRL